MTSISTYDLEPRERIASLVGVTICFLVPAYLSSADLGLSLVDATNPMAMLINEGAIWAVTLALLAIVVFWERQPLTSIGLGRPGWEAICLGALCVAPLIVLSMAMGAVLRAFGASESDHSQTGMILSLPLWLQVFIGITAGFTEEILFRGYAIERATRLTGNRVLGAFLPIMIFGFVHLPFWGTAHAVIAGSTGFWLSLIYLWRRNLWVNITAHVLLDSVLFVALDINSSL
jgi:membrane protease YdiL (CAAX protease family)